MTDHRFLYHSVVRSSLCEHDTWTEVGRRDNNTSVLTSDATEKYFLYDNIAHLHIVIAYYCFVTTNYFIIMNNEVFFPKLIPVQSKENCIGYTCFWYCRRLCFWFSIVSCNVNVNCQHMFPIPIPDKYLLVRTGLED